jgi:hypothetical protein
MSYWILSFFIEILIKNLIFGFFRKIGVHSWYCLKTLNEHQSDLIFKRMVQELLNFDLFSSLEIP